MLISFRKVIFGKYFEHKEVKERQVFKLLFVSPFSHVSLSLFYSTFTQSLTKLKFLFCKKMISNEAPFKFYMKNYSEKYNISRHVNTVM